MKQEIFELKVELTNLGKESQLESWIETEDSQTLSKVNNVNEKLHETMGKLVNLQAQRAVLIKAIQNEIRGEGEEEQSRKSLKERTTIKKKGSRFSNLGKQRTEIRKEMRKAKKNQQELERKVRLTENSFKQISTELKVKQKQKEDLILFKKKSERNKNSCNVDQDLVKKYQSASSEELIKKIKKLSKKSHQYTEKDKVIYNKLDHIQNKQTIYQDQVKIIKENKGTVANQLEICDRKIEELSEDYFNNFKENFFRYFRIFEPRFVVRANLVNLTQKSLR